MSRQVKKQIRGFLNAKLENETRGSVPRKLAAVAAGLGYFWEAFFFSSHHKWEETYPDFLSPCIEDNIPNKWLIRKGPRKNNKHISICMYICIYISCPKDQLDLKIQYSDPTTKRWRTANKNMRFLSEKQLQFQGTRE